MGKGGRGAGEVSETVFSVPKGTLGFWQERLSKEGVKELGSYSLFGEDRLRFAGPDGDGFALAEVEGDSRVRLLVVRSVSPKAFMASGA